MSGVSLPASLVPPDVDLQDFAFMPFDVQRLLKSETWILGNGDERAAAVALWLQSWHQVPSGSLPDNDRMLAHLSGSADKWKRVRDHALRGWLLCADGRLYHPVVCEKALEAWIEKLSNSMSGATGNAKRWGVEVDVSVIRAKFLMAVGLLRALAPQSRTLKKKIVAVIVSGSRGDSPPDSPRDDADDSPPDESRGSPPDSPPDCSGDRKGQGQRQLIEKGERASPVPPFPRALAYEGADPAEQAADGIRQAGFPGMVAQDPDLRVMLAQGLTVGELVDAAVVAKARRKGIGWAFGRAVGRRREAIERMAEVGVPAAPVVPPAETVAQYLARVAAEREAANTPRATVDTKALRDAAHKRAADARLAKETKSESDGS